MSWDLVNNELEELHAIFTATEMTESNNTIYHRHHYHHYHHHPSLPDEEEEEEEEEEVYVQRKEEVEDNNDLLPRAKTQDQTAVEEVIFQWQQAVRIRETEEARRLAAIRRVEDAHAVVEERLSQLLHVLRRELKAMAESGEVAVLRLLETYKAIDRIPAEDINQVYEITTPCLLGEGWGSNQKNLQVDNRKKDLTILIMGVTALHISAALGHAEMVRLLLLHPQIEVNAVDSENQVTPFYLACQCGKIEVVRVLLSQDGLEMDKPDKKGQTPFHIACSNGYEEIVKLLLLAAEDRVNINAVTLDGCTPFYAACRHGHVMIVNLLLATCDNCAVDINMANARDETPFYAACCYGHREVVELLLENKKVNIMKANEHGWTPFYATCMRGHAGIVPLFSDNLPSVTQENKKGWTPLHIACLTGQVGVVKVLLLNDNLIISKTDKNGKTALDMAKTEAIKQLLSGRAMREESKRRVWRMTVVFRMVLLLGVMILIVYYYLFSQVDSQGSQRGKGKTLHCWQW
eukprot:scaffold4347_cov269-Ochromonas_danica.AAC.1